MKIRPLTQLDFYKTGHFRQYPKGTTMVYSNLTPRSIRHAPHIPFTNDKIVVFGLQYSLKWFLIESFNEHFFNRPKNEVVGYYKRRIENALGKDAITIQHIEQLHDLGYLPLSIRALPEGAVVNERTPVFTIQNTKDEFFWLTNYLETILSNLTWKMCTSATTAYKYRQLLTYFAKITGGDLGFVPFQAHDFSFRGMNGPQDAVTSGAGHLTSFVGTDTVPAIDFLEDYYHANSDNELIGTSVPATEHSVACLSTEEYGAQIAAVEEEFNETTKSWKIIRKLNEKELISMSR